MFASDVDPVSHRLWGMRMLNGHMGEYFIEANYLTNTQKVLGDGINLVGRYERIAYVERLY